MYGPEHPNREAHRYHCAELTVILSGRALHFINTGTQRLQAGDVLVLHGPRRHSFRDTAHLKLMCLQFDSAVFLPEDAEVRATAGLRHMFGFNTPAARRHSARRMCAVDDNRPAVAGSLPGICATRAACAHKHAAAAETHKLLKK